MKNETLNQRIKLLEDRVKEYENSFDLIQKQFKQREKTVKELTSLNENALDTIQTLPKIDAIISKINPQSSTVSVQTSFSQLPIPKDQSLQTQSKSITKTEGSPKFGVAKTRPSSEKTEIPFSSQKNVFASNKGKETGFKLPQSTGPKAPPKQSIITKNESPINKSHDFDDDMNLLLDDKDTQSVLPTSQSTNLGVPRTGGIFLK